MPTPAIVKTTVQATALCIVSNVLAQTLHAYRDDAPLVFEYRPIANFVLFTLINCPPNVVWQQFLEDTFPGYAVRPVVQQAEGEKGKEIVPEKRLDVRNTAIKFTLDQTLGAAVNNAFFIATMAALRGASYDEVVGTVQQDFWPLMMAAYKLWPAVSLLNFTVVPVQHRIVFGSIVGVGWGVFLALLASN